MVVAQPGQRIGDELMNLLPRNMAQVEVFILQIKFPSLNLPGQCDIKICQVHVVSLEDEVTIVEQVLKSLNTEVDPIALFLSGGPLQLSAMLKNRQLALCH